MGNNFSCGFWIRFVFFFNSIFCCCQSIWITRHITIYFIFYLISYIIIKLADLLRVRALVLVYGMGESVSMLLVLNGKMRKKNFRSLWFLRNLLIIAYTYICLSICLITLEGSIFPFYPRYIFIYIYIYFCLFFVFNHFCLFGLICSCSIFYLFIIFVPSN